MTAILPTTEGPNPEKWRFHREYVDGNGVTVRVRVELDLAGALDREIMRLTNKVRGSKRQRCASSAGNTIRVCVVERPQS